MTTVHAVVVTMAFLLVLSSLLWVTLHVCMPGEEKIITEAFRRRKRGDAA